MGVAEGVVLAVIIMLGLVVTIVPLAIAGSSALESLESAASGDDPAAFIRWVLFEHPFLVMYAIIALTAIVVIAVAVHSFVRAGFIGVYIDGDRAAGASSLRDGMKVFTPERWFTHGRRGWWQVFLIYQVTWGLYGLVLLVPIVAVGALLMMTMDTEAVVFVGCGGVLVVMLIAFLGGLFVSVWTQLALTEAVRLNLPAGKAIRAGTAMLRARPGEIFAAVIILFGAVIVVMMLFAVLYMMIGALSIIPLMSIVTIPFQIVLSIAQSAVQTFMAGWFIAVFVAIAIRGESDRSGPSPSFSSNQATPLEAQ